MPLELYLGTAPLGIHVHCGGIGGISAVRGEPMEMSQSSPPTPTLIFVMVSTFTMLPRLVIKHLISKEQFLRLWLDYSHSPRLSPPFSWRGECLPKEQPGSGILDHDC